MVARSDDHTRQRDPGRAPVGRRPAFPTRSEIWLKLLECREADLAAERSAAARSAEPARPGRESLATARRSMPGQYVQTGTALAWSSSGTRAPRHAQPPAPSHLRARPGGSRAHRPQADVSGAWRRRPRIPRNAVGRRRLHRRTRPQPYSTVKSAVIAPAMPKPSRYGSEPGLGPLRTPNWMIGARPLAPEEQEPSVLNRRYGVPYALRRTDLLASCAAGRSMRAHDHLAARTCRAPAPGNARLRLTGIRGRASSWLPGADLTAMPCSAMRSRQGSCRQAIWSPRAQQDCLLTPARDKVTMNSAPRLAPLVT